MSSLLERSIAVAALVVVGAFARPAAAWGWSSSREPTRAVAASQYDEAGSVVGMNGDVLTWSLYSGGERSARVDANVPVFQGRGRITTRGLMRGVDVRVRWSQGPSGAVASTVDVLTPEEARAARSSAPVAMPTYRPVERPEYRAPVVVMRPEPTRPRDSGWTRNDVLARADGKQAGRIVALGNGQLILDPYEQAAGEARLLWNAGTPVFQGYSMIDERAVRPGSDVRIHFSTSRGQRPMVVAIDLLTPDEVRLAMRDDNPRGAFGRAGRLEGPSQPGRLERLDDGWLVLDPYQRAAGDARLRFDRDVPIFRDGERVSMRELDRGDDIRVYYAGNRVTAVALLDRDEAREARRQNEFVPRGQ